MGCPQFVPKHSGADDALSLSFSQSRILLRLPGQKHREETCLGYEPGYLLQHSALSSRCSRDGRSITFASHTNFGQVDIGQRGLGRNTVSSATVHRTSFRGLNMNTVLHAQLTTGSLFYQTNIVFHFPAAIQMCMWAVGLVGYVNIIEAKGSEQDSCQIK